jgi:hypothetical protein
MKLLIAALALLSFVATSTLPETVVAQAAPGQTQTTPDQTDTGTPKSTKKRTPRKHVTSKKKSSTKKSTTKKHVTSKKKLKTKKKPTTTTPNPS